MPSNLSLPSFQLALVADKAARYQRAARERRLRRDAALARRAASGAATSRWRRRPKARPPAPGPEEAPARAA